MKERFHNHDPFSCHHLVAQSSMALMTRSSSLVLTRQMCVAMLICLPVSVSHVSHYLASLYFLLFFPSPFLLKKIVGGARAQQRKALYLRH